MPVKSIEELDEELCEYCPLQDDLKGTYGTPNGYYSCEGSRCDQAYDAYLEQCEVCEVCEELIPPGEGDEFISRSKGLKFWLCDKCIEEGDMY